MAQVLLTHDDLRDRRRYLNARSALLELLRLGAVPVVNENDTVAVDELKLGDNDNLAAAVASLVDAELLLIATDIAGLYSGHPGHDPAARPVARIEAITPVVLAMAGDAGALGTGGMRTKLDAAAKAATAGISTALFSGRDATAVAALGQGRLHGTLVDAQGSRLRARKQWLRHAPAAGALEIDAGASAALLRGASLLPGGVRGVAGDFRRGDVIEVRAADGTVLARGPGAIQRTRRCAHRRSPQPRDRSRAGLPLRRSDDPPRRSGPAAGRRPIDHRKQRGDHGMSGYVRELALAARAAQAAIAAADAATRRALLEGMAGRLLAGQDAILAANAGDLERARLAGAGKATLDRLALNPERVRGMAEALREVAAQDDPLGQVTRRDVRPNGLVVERQRIPLGLVAMIFEARPNVTAEAAALCLKAGNAVLLRGGSEAAASNAAIAACLHAALRDAGLPEAAVSLVVDPAREHVLELLQLTDLVDLAIPRGGESLIRFVAEHARVPVIKHYKGVCHLYVDRAADPDLALGLLIDGKTSRPGVCNALETLLVHRRHRRGVPAARAGGAAGQRCRSPWRCGDTRRSMHRWPKPPRTTTPPSSSTWSLPSAWSIRWRRPSPISSASPPTTPRSSPPTIRRRRRRSWTRCAARR